MDREELIKALVTKYRWSEEAVMLGIRAKFRCEYCDRDLLASVNDYDAWQNDHIIPNRPDREACDNKAISCKTCNFIKRSWIPPDYKNGMASTRTEVIERVRHHLSGKRAEKLVEVAAVRAIAIQLIASEAH